MITNEHGRDIVFDTALVFYAAANTLTKFFQYVKIKEKRGDSVQEFIIMLAEKFVLIVDLFVVLTRLPFFGEEGIEALKSIIENLFTFM